MDFSPDGTALAIAVHEQVKQGHRSVLFIETDRWREVRRINLAANVIRVHDQLRYSRDGSTIVIGVSDTDLGRGVTTRDSQEVFRRVGQNFQDERLAAVVLDAHDGRVLAQKTLHWNPKLNFLNHMVAFDASGERVVSSVYAGGVFESHEEQTFRNCTSYLPPTVPDGFVASDLCARNRRIQVWHWRRDHVETVFQTANYVRSRHAVESPEQSLWGYQRYPQFSEDGRYLLSLANVTEKADFDGFYQLTSYALEIRDARNYALLLRKAFRPKEQIPVREVQFSLDGRFVHITLRESQRPGRQPQTSYVFEIVAEPSAGDVR